MKSDNLRNFALICFVILALAASCTVSIGRAAEPTRPAQAPFIYHIDDDLGIITVWHPAVCGSDSGIVFVTNATTGENGALYLDYVGCYAGLGVYKTNPIQLVTMGSGLYFVTDGRLGVMDIYIPSEWQVFEFTARRLWAPTVMR